MKDKRYRTGFVFMYGKYPSRKWNIIPGEPRIKDIQILKPNKKFKILIEAYSNVPYEQDYIASEDGLYLSEAVKLCVRGLREMYKEEEKTSSIKEQSVTPKSFVRNQTNGKYEIYGHFLDDLAITDIKVVDGNIVYPFISS